MKLCSCGSPAQQKDHRCRECRNRRRRELRAGAPLLKKGPQPKAKPGHSRTVSQRRAAEAKIAADIAQMLRDSPGLAKALQIMREMHACGR